MKILRDACTLKYGEKKIPNLISPSEFFGIPVSERRDWKNPSPLWGGHRRPGASAGQSSRWCAYCMGVRYCIDLGWSAGRVPVHSSPPRLTWPWVRKGPYQLGYWYGIKEEGLPYGGLCPPGLRALQPRILFSKNRWYGFCYIPSWAVYLLNTGRVNKSKSVD